MKKNEAINAIKALEGYIEQNKCFEVFKPKNDNGMQSAVIRYLNEAKEKRKNFMDWADGKIGAMDSGNDTLLAEYKIQKQQFDELVMLVSWVSCLPYSTEY